jgi:uncharacterized membrane protein
MGIRRAGKWYRWLWLSPLFTLPTLLLLSLGEYGHDLVCPRPGPCNWQAAGVMDLCIGVLGSALWHLVLLVPILDREHPFVSWHGRQALLLAGARTVLPLVLALIPGVDVGFLLVLPINLAIWFLGTRWGQRQAARGECSLVRWCGRGDVLDSLRSTAQEVQVWTMQPDAVVDIIRHSRDPELRRAALERAVELHMVEPL